MNLPYSFSSLLKFASLKSLLKYLSLAQPQLIALAAIPAGLLFSTIFYASLYFTVTDCFAVEAQPDAAAREQA